jgi:ferredoxin-NADP reductase/Na+-translocating ferredoxin:NAD+ oxidoreductase RnfD subunit
MINQISSTVAYVLAIPNRLTDKIGMYRLVTVSLWFIFACSLIASVLGLISYSITAQLVSVSLALATALGLNIGLAKIFRIHANHESAVITALILYFMMIPYVGITENWALLAATALAIISKYLITYRRQHIFNAAAFGAVALVVLVGSYNLVFQTSYNTDIFSWWVSNPVLFWPVVITGILIVSKIRRWAMIGSFIAVGLVVFLIESYRLDIPLLGSTYTYFFSFPTLFLAFFMLTEPFTTPPKSHHQVWYGALVGALSSTIIFAPVVSMTPELALVIGNAFAYTFRIRRKLFLQLISKRLIATDTWEFTFSKPDGFSFEAGQYVEWMLPHQPKDSRGTRRYFTIASAPTESVIRLALKVVPTDSDMRGSTYKAALMQLDHGQEIIVSQLAGDFTLPKSTEIKLGFIAGGIGATPFSSHLSWMQDSGKQYDTRLYYCANTVAELAYKDEFDSMSQHMPVIAIPVIAKEAVQTPYESGFVTAEMLARRTPDYKQRTWYISGPPGMVNAYKNLLKESGVPHKQIKTDFFPGLA